MNDLTELLRDAHVILCCGTGGVGKTTTAAAIALAAAQRGYDTVVVTIDPARRLADALGLSSLTNEPAEIDRTIWDPDGIASHSGRLSALMLDVKHTFDGLVRRYSDTDEQATRILDNRVYTNLASALSGTQEYMAAEKLYELHESQRFDLIVIDTPPSRHALDFLNAPDRLLRLLDNRLFRVLMGSTRTGLKVARSALHRLFRTVARAAGPEVIDDVVLFLQAFEGMEEGFRARSEQVMALVEDPSTRFVVVTTPRQEAIVEAEYFAAHLADDGHPVAALVVNRVHPEFGGPNITEARAFAARVRGTALSHHLENLADFAQVAASERTLVAEVAQRVRAPATASVPFLPTDVHDITALRRVAAALFPGDRGDRGQPRSWCADSSRMARGIGARRSGR